MKHFGFPADAFIGYIRIARPGSVLGPQQQFLNEIQDKMFNKGVEFRKQHGISEDVIMKFENLKLASPERIKFSENDKRIAQYGDKGQGEFLTDNKKGKK